MNNWNLSEYKVLKGCTANNVYVLQMFTLLKNPYKMGSSCIKKKKKRIMKIPSKFKTKSCIIKVLNSEQVWFWDLVTNWKSFRIDICLKFMQREVSKTCNIIKDVVWLPLLAIKGPKMYFFKFCSLLLKVQFLYSMFFCKQCTFHIRWFIYCFCISATQTWRVYENWSTKEDMLKLEDREYHSQTTLSLRKL